jgi:hypothetical protein
MKLRLAFVPVLFASVALTGCAQGGPSNPAGGPPAETSAAPGTTGESGGQLPAAPPATEPTTPSLEYRVSYDWGIPSNEVTVSHPLTAPIAAPPAPPLPYLVGIYVGDHPEGSPPYQRISYYFRGAFPSYNFKYALSVVSEGAGTPIPLQGNAFLGIRFVEAQAHDEAGASTLKASPPSSIGFQNLKSYGFGGDYEGYVTYGLGIQVAPGSDQVLKIRAGELKKPDGAGGFFYVVHFDVQNG